MSRMQFHWICLSPLILNTFVSLLPLRIMSDAYDRNRAAQRNAVDLDFSFDVYYHTSVSDPRCMVRR